MTEMEELENNAKLSKWKQTVGEASAYLDRLTDAIDVARRQHNWSFGIYIVVWLSWVAAGFWSPEIDHAMETVFLFALIYDGFRFARLQAATAEFLGAIRMLKILGMIPPDRDEGEKKKRRTMSEFFDMVKGWAIKKQKAQEEVYAPA